MKVQITEIHGLRDSIRSLYMSKRSWDWEKEKDIESVVKRCVNTDGSLTPYAWGDVDFNDLVKRLLKWGQIHPTLLRFIDISAVVEGLHRGATDDFDSHARRLDNRIIRSSRRKGSGAAPELQEMMESLMDQLEEWYPWFDREYVLGIEQ